MIVDSSALIAILLHEPDANRLDTAIVNSPDCRMSAANLLEISIVLTARKGQNASWDLDLIVARMNIQIVAFTESQARLARRAFEQFRKGRHPAGLNFGDCMAYALAKETGEELLFKGTDFSLTDVSVAKY